jgi:hypothetical protein
VNTSANNSAAIATYTAQLNTQSIVRDYAIQFINNLSVTTVDSIKLQASTMSYLTDATTELTRQAIVCILCNIIQKSFFEYIDNCSIKMWSSNQCIKSDG